MFRWKIARNSLSFKIGFIAILGVAISLLITASSVALFFNKAINHGFSNYLTAYMDMFIVHTEIEDKDRVTFTLQDNILSSIPRIWQINVDGAPYQKSATLSQFIIGTPADDSINTVTFDKTITYTAKTVNFPGNRNITYIFGLESNIAGAYLQEEYRRYYNGIIVSLLILGVSSFIIILCFIPLIIAPIRKLKHSVAQLRHKEGTINPEKFPTEVQPLVGEVNAIFSHNEQLISRYRMFASNLSHALKTPLTVIHGEAQRNKGTFPDIVKEKSLEMQSLIERNLARVAISGPQTRMTKNIKCKSLLSRIIKNLSKLYQKEYQIIGNEAELRMNEADFIEMAGNLIENALEHATSHVYISIAGEEEHITITIEDNGQGLPQEQYAHVLERGTRLDTNVTGTGIGLPIAKEICEIYNGTLTLNASEYGGIKAVLRF